MIVEAKPRPPKIERPIGAFDAALAAELAGSYELVPASREKLVEKLPAAILDSVAKMAVTVEGSHIVVKANGQSPFLAFPAKDRATPSFFTKHSDIELFPAVLPGSPGSPGLAGHRSRGRFSDRAARARDRVRARYSRHLISASDEAAFIAHACSSAAPRTCSS